MVPAYSACLTNTVGKPDLRGLLTSVSGMPAKRHKYNSSAVIWSPRPSNSFHMLAVRMVAVQKVGSVHGRLEE